MLHWIIVAVNIVYNVKAPVGLPGQAMAVAGKQKGRRARFTLHAATAALHTGTAADNFCLAGSEKSGGA